MEILEAVVRLEARQDRSVFPVELAGDVDDDVDVWPEVTAAAVLVSGCLEDAKTDDDLDAALQTFQALYSEDEHSGGTVTPAAWKAAVGTVMDAVEQCVVDFCRRNQAARPGGDFSLN